MPFSEDSDVDNFFSSIWPKEILPNIKSIKKENNDFIDISIILKT
jgi:hypothetical protein